MSKADGFLKHEVAKILGVNPRTILSWTEKELVVPEIENPSGQGKKPRYSITNLVEIALIKELLRVGVRVSEIRQFVKGCQDELSPLWKKEFKLEANFRKNTYRDILFNPDFNTTIVKNTYLLVGRLPEGAHNIIEVALEDDDVTILSSDLAQNVLRMCEAVIAININQIIQRVIHKLDLRSNANS